MSVHFRRSKVASIALVATILAACGSNDGSTDESASPTSEATDATTADEPEAGDTAEPAAEAETIQARISLTVPEGHQGYVGAQAFADALAENSNSRIEVQIFPGAQLGGVAESMELLATGAVEFAEHDLLATSGQYNEPKLEVFALPFLYEDVDHAYAAWDDPLAQPVYDVMENHGFKCLSRHNNGFRQVHNSVREVNSPEDLSGLRLRTPEGRLFESTWNALGAEPVLMPFPELATSLETGSVDGAELPFSAFAAFGFADLQSYVSEINYLNDPVCFSVSLEFWDGLDADLQEAVIDAAAAGQEANRAAEAETTISAREAIENEGIAIATPDLAPFQELLQPVYDDVLAELDDDARSLVEHIRTLR